MILFNNAKSKIIITEGMFIRVFYHLNYNRVKHAQLFIDLIPNCGPSSLALTCSEISLTYVNKQTNTWLISISTWLISMTSWLITIITGYLVMVMSHVLMEISHVLMLISHVCCLHMLMRFHYKLE